MKRKGPPPGSTEDAFYRGRFRVIQSKTGYRFALDAPLLADFIRTTAKDEVCELGTGSGIIAILLSLKPFRRLTALEIQPGLARLAERNVALNGLGSRIRVLRADFRRYRPRRRFDVVFANPPYIPKKSGFLSPSRQKSIAKHEITCDILEVMGALSALLKRDGRAYIIYPAARKNDLRSAASTRGLSVRRGRIVLPRPDRPAAFFLAELRFGRGAERTAEPLVLRNCDGKETAAARAVFEGKTRGSARR